MPATAPSPSRYGATRPSRAAWSLTLAVHLVVALLFLIQKREPIVKMAERGLTTFNIAPEAPEGSETEKTETREEKKREAQAASQDAPVPAEPPPLPPPPVVSEFQPRFLVLSSADYAASNMANGSTRRPAAQPAEGQGDSKAPVGPGAGPGGAVLFPADWYREPTDTELGGYLRPSQPRQGWGMIACKTVARFKVEDCYILGESPRGSGFGKSVLDASWQFQVMPPRVNGRNQVGTWVSIRIDYTPAGAGVR